MRTTSFSVRLFVAVRILAIALALSAVSQLALPHLYAGVLVVTTRPTFSGPSPVDRFDDITGAFIDTFSADNPHGIVFGPDGNIYVSSFSGSSVSRFDGTTGAPLGVFVPSHSGGLSAAEGLVFGDDGNLYVNSAGTNQVLRYDGATGAFIDVFASDGGLSFPHGLVFGPDGNLYVSSSGTSEVLRYDGATGAFIDVFASGGGLSFPSGVVFGPDGNLYVNSRSNNQVLRYNGTTGAFIDVFASGGGQLAEPNGLLFGPDSNLYVAGGFTDQVVRYDGTTGAFIDVFASTDSNSYANFLTFDQTDPTTLAYVGVSADLAVTKADTPDPVIVGQNLTYTLTVTNNGPSPATGVTVTDTLPGGVTLVSSSASQGSCSGASAITCTLGNLADDASATVTITVQPTAVGSLTNTASVQGNQTDPTTGNDTDTEITTVRPAADVAITMTDSPDPVKVKGTLTYTLTVSNHGPSPATGVTVTDTLPSGVTFGSVTTTQGSCTSSVTCNLGTLASGATATITITVSPQAAGTLTNSANVTAAETDPTTSNNSPTTTTAVTTSGTPFRLTVAVAGNGKVTSNPAGIDCGLGSATCQATYNNGTVVTLTATPAAGARFDHWEKGCTGTSLSCSVTMDSNISLKAVFKKQ